MFTNIKNAFKDKEIRKKIFITLALILVFRLGCFIPVPGFNQFNPDALNNSLLGIMSAITGGALQNGTILALGIAPYINASIIVQLLSMAIPAMERMAREGGEEGKKKLSQITRIVTLILAIVQAVGIVVGMSGSIDPTIFGNNLIWLTQIFVVVILTAGAAFTMWLGEKMTQHGVGNGISLIIFVGILSTAGGLFLDEFSIIFGGSEASLTHTLVLIGFVLVCILIFAFIVFVDLGERKIPVQYAKQIKGRKMYGGQSTVIPIKVNSSGVMPLIFAFTLINLPQLIANTFWPNATDVIEGWAFWFSGQSPFPFYSIALSLLILGFSYFYAQVQFNPDEVSRQIQQYGGFIPGIRPGKPTTDYLKKISKRITLFGAIFLAIIALIPSILFSSLSTVTGQAGFMNAFSATGLLIIVSVALELDKQLESQIVMKVQKGFLK